MIGIEATDIAVCSNCGATTPVSVDDYLEKLAAWGITFQRGEIIAFFCPDCVEQVGT